MSLHRLDRQPLGLRGQLHVIGPFAGELIAEAAVAMAFRASSEDIGMICHAHPSLSEAMKDAALAVATLAAPVVATTTATAA